MRPTKKAQILAMYPDTPDVEAIARVLDTSPTYVANTLMDAGHAVTYSDVFTSSRQPTNPYARELAGILRFKDLPTAAASVALLDEVHQHYAGRQDFRGIFQVQQLALLGKLRARALGKDAESRLFADWLAAH